MLTPVGMTPEVARQLILCSVNKDLSESGPDTPGPDINDLKDTMSRMDDFRLNNEMGLILVLMVGADRKTGEMGALFEVGGMAPSMLVTGMALPFALADHVDSKTEACACDKCTELAVVRAAEHMNSQIKERANG